MSGKGLNVMLKHFLVRWFFLHLCPVMGGMDKKMVKNTILFLWCISYTVSLIRVVIWMGDYSVLDKWRPAPIDHALTTCTIRLIILGSGFGCSLWIIHTDTWSKVTCLSFLRHARAVISTMSRCRVRAAAITSYLPLITCHWTRTPVWPCCPVAMHCAKENSLIKSKQHCIRNWNNLWA